MDYFYELGINLVLVIQGLGEWLLTPMKLFSFMGSAEFYFLILTFLYWCIDSTLGVRVGLILLVSNWINDSLKIGIHSARPFWVSRRVESFVFEYSFGFPSGHAQNSAAVFGLLAATFQQWWVRLISLSLIFLIGISRIYLAVHFPQDVILGWLIGFLLVWIFLRFEKQVALWFQHQTLPISILILFLASISMLLIGFLLRYLVAGWQMPLAWIENARLAFPDKEIINPLSTTGLLLTSGVFFGFSSGTLWLSTRVEFSAKGTWDRRISRFFLGFIGVAIMWFGVGSFLPEEAGIFSYMLSYLIFSGIGLWISAFAPLIFLHLKLAEPKSN